MWKINASMWFDMKMKNSLMEDERKYKLQREHAIRTQKAHPTSENILVL